MSSTPTTPSAAYPDVRLLIDNTWQDAQSGKRIDVRNPATGAVMGQVAHAGTVDLDRALAAAQRGFEVWRDTPPSSVPKPCAALPPWCASAPTTLRNC